MTQPQKFYQEISVVVPQRHVDAVSNFIIENITSGMVLEDEEDCPTTGIKFYLPEDSIIPYQNLLTGYFNSLMLLDAGFVDFPGIKCRLIKSLEWEEAYRQSVETIIIDDMAIRPPWHNRSEHTAYDIVIEPKMAFGTGHHETTRSCLRLIRTSFSPGKTFLDLGCGSGILSILAAKMGATYIKAIDYDPTAVDNCIENFVKNNIETPHNIIHGSIERCESDPPYDFVCANIIKSTVLEMLEMLIALTKTGEALVLSGLLSQDEADISRALKRWRQHQYQILPDNEWRTYLVTRQ